MEKRYAARGNRNNRSASRATKLRQSTRVKNGGKKKRADNETKNEPKNEWILESKNSVKDLV